MRRRRVTDPNIYQVDLVAGLFGGFLLVWLASALADEAPPGDYSPIIVSVRAVLPSGKSIADFGTTTVRCLSNSEISKFELKIAVSRDCPKEIRPYANHVIDDIINVAPRIIRECSANAGKKINVTVNRIIALRLSPPPDWKPMAFVENPPSKPSATDVNQCHLDLHAGGYTAVYILPPKYSLSSLQDSKFEYDRSAISVRSLWTQSDGVAWRSETDQIPESNNAYSQEKGNFQGDASLRVCGYQSGTERCFDAKFDASQKSGTIVIAP
jgi:hypothetical protein